MGNLKMNLTDQHINFETDCRQIFVGRTIHGVIYGEVKYYADENGQNINPEPYYRTKYSDVDTLDHSIYFKTEKATIYVYWDNTFVCYGLQSKELDFTEKTNDYEQKWDVSAENKWINIVGQKIIDFKINWEETWNSNLDGSNKIYATYPQSFEIHTDNQKVIILSASEFKNEENEIYYLMDNLLVTTNGELAKQLKLIA